MSVFQYDRFAIAGHKHALGGKVAAEDWPTDQIEQDFFDAGRRQAQEEAGIAVKPLPCMDTTDRCGCGSDVSLHPANWR